METLKPPPPFTPLLRKILKRLIGANNFRNFVGRHEHTSEFIWERLSSELNKQSAILDIGAYVGEYSIKARLKNPYVSIHAFEPNKITIKQLKENIIDLNIKVSDVAISDKCQKVLFTNQNAASRIVNDQSNDYPTFEVKTTTLDKYQEENNIDIKLIKIDTEGNEFKILNGASNVLKNYSPIICCEVLSDEEGNRLSILLKESYIFYQVDEKYKRIAKRPLINRELWRNKNWFFVPIAQVDNFENSISKSKIITIL
tara:strand:+ start:200 stop:970 length:771 start_codon:yes stop_codon:yes gene_type:complete